MRQLTNKDVEKLQKIMIRNNLSEIFYADFIKAKKILLFEESNIPFEIVGLCLISKN